MKEKINAIKGIILLIVILLIAIVGYVAVVRYQIRLTAERVAKEEISRSKTFNNSDLVVNGGQTMQISVFFQNSKLANDPNVFDCKKVFAVSRTIDRVPGVARQALQELLLGPTESERGNGYATAISKEIGLHLNSVSSDDGALVISFNRSPFMGGSCALQAVVSQITETAKQFPSVKTVKILVDGNEEWMNP